MRRNLAAVLVLATSALAAGCAQGEPERPTAAGSNARPATASPATTPGPTEGATPPATPSRALDPNVCPEDWRSAMLVAWGYADDLAAPRSTFTTAERRMDLQLALPLVEAIPRWQPGEVVRTGLAHLFAIHVAIEAAHQSGDRRLEASLHETADQVLREAWEARKPLFDEANDPCYRPGMAGREARAFGRTLPWRGSRRSGSASRCEPVQSNSSVQIHQPPSSFSPTKPSVSDGEPVGENASA